jgi:hypothetical protein
MSAEEAMKKISRLIDGYLEEKLSVVTAVVRIAATVDSYEATK